MSIKWVKSDVKVILVHLQTSDDILLYSTWEVNDDNGKEGMKAYVEVAVAVKAMIGTFGKRCLNFPNCL